MGGYERDPAPWSLDGIPADFNGKLLEEDWPRFEPLLENAIRRVPALEEMEVVRLINGPEAFTPDGEFILGPTDVRGFWVAAGLLRARPRRRGRDGASSSPSGSSRGRRASTSGTWTRAASAPRTATRDYTLARTTRGLLDLLRRQVPGARAPGRPAAARSRPPIRASQELGAVVRREVRLGARELVRAERRERATRSLRPRGWAGRHWSPAIGAEHRACREAAALFDESSFAKIEVVRRRARPSSSSRLCDNRVARDVGAITYTQMLNARGGIECDFTVTRLAEERFRIVTGTAFGRHDLAWIRQHAPDDGSVTVDGRHLRVRLPRALGPDGARDPRSRSRRDLARLPVHAGARARGGPVPCLALRVTYVGELGWELYCPSEFGLRLWDALWEAGREHGLVAGGYKAIDSLRLEKGYRVWGADITADDTPVRGRTRLRGQARQGRSIGQEALCSPPGSRSGGSRCVTLADPRAVALGSEPVRVGGRARGPRHERRLRLHGRALDRVRLPARRERRAGHARRGRDLRRVGRRRGRRRAAVRPERGATPRLVAFERGRDGLVQLGV